MIHHEASREFLLGTLKAEKARHGLTFENLSQRLKAIGIEQSASNLGSKFSTGVMSAQLFIALLSVLEVRSLAIPPTETDDSAE
ncbi:DUF6471 domain-containing protein [uncultured Abyssibacter sp.]|uniref:DUF6471 domain-containing protein n=1 Tax=uncultured Abyssibacter sp. TaxID=2320202 RepID=UPI0032B1D856